MNATADLFDSKEHIYRGAHISPCGRYRYYLERSWNIQLPWMGFCMLNPSTADANTDDQTIRKCMGFARRHGCGGIIVVNVCAFRATNPKELLSQHDPVGKRSVVSHCYEVAMDLTAFSGGKMVVAWGKQMPALERRGCYIDALSALRNVDYRNACAPYPPRRPPIYCLGTTKDGHPRHPCYLPYDTELEEFGGVKCN